VSTLKEGLILLKMFELVSLHEKFPKKSNMSIWNAIKVADEHENDRERFVIFIEPYDPNSENLQLRQFLFAKHMKMLHMLESLPNGEEHYLTAKYYGVDDEHSCFVTAFEESHAQQALSNAALKSDLFKNHRLQREQRTPVWEAFYQLAEGLNNLHNKNILHKNIAIDQIVLGNDKTGFPFRLSGFSYASRIGETGNSNNGESTHGNWGKYLTDRQKSYGIQGYSFITDWMALAAAIFTTFTGKQPRDKEDFKSNLRNSSFDQIEKDFFRYLLLDNDKYITGKKILDHIDRIQKENNLHISKEARRKELLLFCLTGNDKRLVNILEDDGLLNAIPSNKDFKEILQAWFEQEKNNALSIHVGKINSDYIALKFSRVKRDQITASVYFKIGKQLVDKRHDGYSWKKAGSLIDIYQRAPKTESDWIDITNRVDLNFNIQIPPVQDGGWKDLFDELSKTNVSAAREQAKERQFRAFLSVANEMEILLRYGQIYGYKVTKKDESKKDDKVIVELEIKELEEAPIEPRTKARSYFNGDKSLLDYLDQEGSRGAEQNQAIYLGGAQDGTLQLKGSKEQRAAMEWHIDKLDKDRGIICCSKRIAPGKSVDYQVGHTGYLRTFGHYGQISLLDRRTQSISKLQEHRLLVKSLALKGDRTYKKDIEWEYKPGDLNLIDLDANGKKRIQDILLHFPLYTLQGPPGTGKSTIATNLIKVLLSRHPMAQILLTAKDHSAIDVLMRKIGELFREGEKPITLKLEGEAVSDDELLVFLETIYNRYKNTEDEIKYKQFTGDTFLLIKEVINVLTEEKDAKENRAQDSSDSLSATDRTFEENAKSHRIVSCISGLKSLMRNAASLIFATTSAKDLVGMVEKQQIFDWVIVEEAGKTHGFDLALPMQVGYRWLLIGDQEQLQPFMYKEFNAALQSVASQGDTDDSATVILEKLKIDNQIQMLDEEAHKELKGKGKAISDYLETFNWLFNNRSGNEGYPLAFTLDTQRRMPKVLGDLVGDIFYNRDDFRLKTPEDEEYQKEHQNPISSPKVLAEDHITWIDIPAGGNNSEEKPKNGYGIVNEKECNVIITMLKKIKVDVPSEVVVLSPYVKQVSLINGHNNEELADNINLVSVNRKGGKTIRQIAYTVDSFQGDQADIVILSLVGNKNPEKPDMERIEFILEAHRLNVMLSRARKKLIIVGCYTYFKRAIEKNPRQELKQAQQLIEKMEKYCIPLPSDKTPEQFLLGQ